MLQLLYTYKLTILASPEVEKISYYRHNSRCTLSCGKVTFSETVNHISHAFLPVFCLPLAIDSDDKI